MVELVRRDVKALDLLFLSTFEFMKNNLCAQRLERDRKERLFKNRSYAHLKVGLNSVKMDRLALQKHRREKRQADQVIPMKVRKEKMCVARFTRVTALHERFA